MRGNREPSVNTVLTPDGEARLTFTVRKLRYANTSYSTCVRTAEPVAETPSVLRMLRGAGFSGFVAVQTKLDNRTGQHKLIEINPRFGANFRILSRMAIRAGVNLALLTIRASQGYDDGGVRPARLPIGLHGVSPVEDLSTYRVFNRLRSAAAEPDNPPPSRSRFLHSMARTYLRPTTSFDAVWHGLLRDPSSAVASYRRTLTEIQRDRVEFIPWGELC